MIVAHRSLLLFQDLRWFPPCHPRARRMPSRVRDWLAEAASLTARLAAAVGPVRVEVLREGWGRAFPSERRHLHLAHDDCLWVREVVLRHGEVALVAARTVAPRRTLEGRGGVFTRLGSRPLGELLFSHPAIVREECLWTELAPMLWRLRDIGVPRWGRRVRYRIDGAPFLVCEFFLPSVFELEQDHEPTLA